MSELTIAELRELFAYDPETGRVMNRKARPGARANVEAGRDKGHGYRAVYFGGRYHYTHRIAWALHYGEAPPQRIDHIDGDGMNNRIANLRAADHAQNLGNSRRRKDNTSGAKGVSWHTRAGKWTAYIGRTYLGLFETKEEAAAAYERAAVARYGEFARVA